MKLGITYRLFLAILIATGLSILTLFLIIGWSIDRGFYQYLGRMDQNRLEQMAEFLGESFTRHGNWNFLKNQPPDYLAADRRASERGLPMPPKIKGMEVGPPASARDQHGAKGVVILDKGKRVVWGVSLRGKEMNYSPIIVDGKTVGYVGLLSPRHFLHPQQIRFLSEQKVYLALAAFGMVVAVAFLSFPLARRMVKPVKAMLAATREIAEGRYSTRISVTSSDELGQLAAAFNEMASALEKNEKNRRQWVADISHELRTPVSVLQGEIEAVLDGIHPMTIETIRSLHSETLRLKRLINDLYQVSLTDIGALSYHKQKMDIVEELTDAFEAYRVEFARKEFEVTTDFPSEREIIINADPERMDQLFFNVIENSIRYTDDGGSLKASMKTAASNVVIEIEDSSPGVPDEDLGRLFERLYRVEESRSRVSGGAGLGLAICKNIVEAHNGKISAHHSSLGGLLIRITLPVTGGT